jgi:polysaccharide deacetylase family protein (PEP-CTERM system associated)
VNRPVLNGFSVDVEEWFHICGAPEGLAPSHWDTLPSRMEQNTSRVLALLDRHGVRATFFVLGWVAERHPHLLGAIKAAGHVIGSHGHRHDRVYDLGADRFAVDLRASIAALTGAGSGPITCYRAPEWSINERSPWAFDLLAREGITLDSSRAPMRIVGSPEYPEHPHEIPTRHGPLTEAPPFVTRRFGHRIPYGGGWGLRIARPAAVLREVEARNRSGMPVTFWIHPWELDPDPPRVRLPWSRYAAHYPGLSGFERRLDILLGNITFGPLQEMIATCRSSLP